MVKSKRKQLKGLIAIGCALSVSVGAFVFFYVQASKNTVEVPIVTAEVGEGEQFVYKKNYLLAEIPNMGLSPTMVKKAEEVENSYALRKFNIDEYIFSDSISNEYKRGLPERIKFGGVAVNISLLTSGGSELKPDDFVRASIVISDKDNQAVGDISSDNLPSTDTAIVVAQELGALRVLGIYDGSGKSVSAVSKQNEELLASGAKEGDKQSLSPQYIIFDATKKQEALLLQANYSGKLHLTILPEEEQEAYREQWGLSKKGEDKVEVETTNQDKPKVKVVDQGTENTEVEAEDFE